MRLTHAERRLLGFDSAQLVEKQPGVLLHADAARAFSRLAHAASEAGFSLAIASAFRSYTRQREIWNGKLSGGRPVYDDAGECIELEALSERSRIDCVLRFSALPGASRHHWGTDIDVFDAAAVPEDYGVQLSPAEVGPGGCFAALHDWLDAQIANGESFGFYRPYDRDRGGVAAERWHLSYAPLANQYAAQMTPALLSRAWRVPDCEPLLQTVLEAHLPEIFERFVARVAAPPQAAPDPA